MTDNIDKNLLAQTGEKPHFCNVCKKRFSKKDALTDHLRTHTSEKPHVVKYAEKDLFKKAT